MDEHGPEGPNVGGALHICLLCNEPCCLRHQACCDVRTGETTSPASEREKWWLVLEMKASACVG